MEQIKSNWNKNSFVPFVPNIKIIKKYVFLSKKCQKRCKYEVPKITGYKSIYSRYFGTLVPFVPFCPHVHVSVHVHVFVFV